MYHSEVSKFKQECKIFPKNVRYFPEKKEKNVRYFTRQYGKWITPNVWAGNDRFEHLATIRRRPMSAPENSYIVDIEGGR